MSKPHEYGSCVRASKLKYNELVRQGKNAILVTGHVKVKNCTARLAHYWVTVGNKIYDPTKDQFDKYGGVVRYYPKDKFKRRSDV